MTCGDFVELDNTGSQNGKTLPEYKECSHPSWPSDHSVAYKPYDKAENAVR